MNKRQQLTVSLPNLTPEVTLPRYQGKVLEMVIASGQGGVSTLQLTEAGCINPAKAISILKKKGALIISEIKDAEDSRGEVRPLVAHYTYCGWLVEASQPHITSNPHKELSA